MLNLTEENILVIGLRFSHILPALFLVQLISSLNRGKKNSGYKYSASINAEHAMNVSPLLTLILSITSPLKLILEASRKLECDE